MLQFLMLLDKLFTCIKGYTVDWLSGTSTAPSLDSVSASLLPGIPWCPRIQTKMTLLNSLSLPSRCICSQTKDDSVVIFASAARTALLSQQMCILLLIRFLLRRSSVHLSRRHRWKAAHRYALPVVIRGSLNTCTKVVINSQPIREINSPVRVDDFTKWYFFQDSTLV